MLQNWRQKYKKKLSGGNYALYSKYLRTDQLEISQHGKKITLK